MPRIITLLCVLLLAGAEEKSKTITVSVKEMSFNPATVTISVGDSVRWMNDDDRDHSVVAADKSFKSGNIRSGRSFTHRFEKPGKFAYGCGYHPRMKGTVVVEE